MKTKEILVIVLLLIVVGAVSYYFGYFNKSDTNVCIDDACFKVEIADDNNERTMGLMNRTFMDNDKGMLFVWESEGYYPFWMKNTLIPLDMIWINMDKEVIFIYENAQPCIEEPCEIIYPARINAMYVLEINGGLADELGIDVGSKLIIR